MKKPVFLIPYLAMVVGLHVLGSAWISFLLYHGLVLLVVCRDRPLLSSLLRGWAPGVGLGAVLFGVGGGALLFVLAPRIGLDAALITPAIARLGLHGTGWLLFVVYHTLVNPWFEEVLWRGWLGSDSVRPVAGDFLFAGYHLLVLVLFLEWRWIALAFGVLVVASWYWRQLRRRHEGLLLPVVSHLAADGSIMAVVYILSLS